MDLETRALPGAEIRSYDEADHQFRARILSYNRADTYGTVWAPGVFASSLAKRMPTVCWNHDMGRPIGRVVEHRDDSDGLEVTVKLADTDAVPDARMAHSLLSDGVVDGFSVGFKRAQTISLPASQRSAFGELPAREKIASAYLGEVSAVIEPSVPGTALLAIRADGDEEVDGLDLETIERLAANSLLSRDEARSLLARSVPILREHITVGGDRTVVANLTVTADSSDDTRDDTTPSADSDDDGDSADDLAAATDAALDSAVYWLSKVDVTSLPDEAQQAVALVQAASVAVDQLLEVMGVDDPDDPSDDNPPGGRTDTDLEVRLAVSEKPWSNFSQADYTPAQYKKACLIWDGPDDDKSSGSLPVLEPDGTVNKNALAAAAGRLGQVDASPDVKKAAAKKLVGLYNQAGLKPGPNLLKQAGGGLNRSDGPEAVFAKHHVA